MPSVYGYNQPVWVEKEDVLYTDQASFHSSVEAEVCACRECHECRECRAALVFFHDEAALMHFYNHASLDVRNACKIYTERLNAEEEDADRYRYIHAGEVKLLTKFFTRGIDFQVTDPDLEARGGPHVLGTFFPATEADRTGCSSSAGWLARAPRGPPASSCSMTICRASRSTARSW